MPIKTKHENSQMNLQLHDSHLILPNDSSLYREVFDLTKQKLTPPDYCHKNGLLFTCDSIEWLKTVIDGSIDLIFADPPYNIKKAHWDMFESQKQYIDWSLLWIEECARILKPTGSLYICGFSEILADLKQPTMNFFKACKMRICENKGVPYAE